MLLDYYINARIEDHIRESGPIFVLSDGTEIDLWEAWKTKGKKLSAAHRKAISDALKKLGGTKPIVPKATSHQVKDGGANVGKAALVKKHPVGTKVKVGGVEHEVTGHTTGYLATSGGKKKWIKITELDDEPKGKVAKKLPGAPLTATHKTKSAKQTRATKNVEALSTLGGKPTKVEYAVGHNKASISSKMGIKEEELEDTLHRLTGGMKNASLRVRVDGDNVVINSNAKIGSAESKVRRIINISNGKITSIENDILNVAGAPKGTGTAMLSKQVQVAQSLGVKQFITEAARKDGTSNGYYTWARLGYDAKVFGPNGKTESLLEIMKTPAGREWWKENGRTTEMTFDLSPGSASMKVLEAYAKEKGVWDG